MSKELIISITPQETKAAIIENDQVVEIHIERDKEHGIVGAICKGRVTKVLPGMQSAFVDIGLERDAFLYVSDFFEDTEEYDKLVSTAEEQVADLAKTVAAPAPIAPHPPVISPEVVGPPSSFFRYADRRGRSRRARRNRLRGKPHENPIPSAPLEVTPPAATESSVVTPVSEPAISILPGESLAKYQNFSPSVEENMSPLEQLVRGESGSMSEAPPIAKHPEEVTARQNDSILPPVTGNELDSLEYSGDAPAEEDEEKRENLAPENSKASQPILASTPFPVNELTSAEELSSLPHDLAHSLEIDETPLVEATEEDLVEAREIALEGAVDIPSQFESSRAVSSESSDPFGTEAESPNLQNTVASDPEITENITSSTVNAPKIQPNTFPAKAGVRSGPGTSKFFRRPNDRRRRQGGPQAERRNEESESRFPLIADLLKEGQEILVQIAKEPLGTKGARITSHIALPGRYLVYMPTVDHIGVSRKIESDDERQRLKRIIQQHRRSDLPGGFIVRTAGEGKGEDEFVSDINFLYALWAEIKTRADKKKAGTIIHRDLNLVQRLLRDQLSSDFSTIRVDNELEFATIVEFINRFQPSLVNRVKLYAKDTPIFEEFGVQSEIDKALRSKVWLKSGGYIVIDQAEALVAIDVNTGKYVGKSNKLEDTIVKTNIEAAKEIARQIRLRDLGGIIVCDFIDMDDRKNRLKVTQTLEEALRIDRSPSKVLQFNDFGLVAITRKRVKQSIMRTLCEPCPSCAGLGMVKSVQTICYEIQTEAKKMGKSLQNKEITIRVNPEVAKALKATEISVVNEIESVLKKEVEIKSDPLLSQEHFDIY
jgi:Rne/Rng family ribonuclease